MNGIKEKIFLLQIKGRQLAIIDNIRSQCMPIYEYSCEKCHKKFEILVMGSDKPACPDCGTIKIRRLMSACGFVSRGSGGETVSKSAGASSCAGCSSSSCSGCGV